jgi:hypothetical protein
MVLPAATDRIRNGGDHVDAHSEPRAGANRGTPLGGAPDRRSMRGGTAGSRCVCYDAARGVCGMSESPLLEMQLRSMHLPTVLANYRRLLSEHTEPLQYLSDLVSLEAAKRQEPGRRRTTAVRSSCDSRSASATVIRRDDGHWDGC